MRAADENRGQVPRPGSPGRVEQLRAWYDGLTGRQLIGVACSAAAVLLTLALSLVTTGSVATSLLFTIIVALFQFGAAWAFQGHGKADPTMARASVRRLVGLTFRAEGAELLAQQLYEYDGLDKDAVRRGVGQVSTHLSYLKDGYLDAIEDWREFHPRAVQAVTEGVDDEPGRSARRQPDDEIGRGAADAGSD